MGHNEENNKLKEKYNEFMNSHLDKSFEQLSELLESLSDKQERESFKKMYCDELLRIHSEGYIEYQDTDYDSFFAQLFVQNVEKIEEPTLYLKLFSKYLKKDFSEFMKLFDQWIDSEFNELNEPMTEADVVDILIEPIKNGCQGFWRHAQKKLYPYLKKDGTHELPTLMAAIYERKSDEEAIDALTEYIQKYPNITTAREYLGCIYTNLKLWNNAIAAFESVEDNLVLFATLPSAYYFSLAWAYGKTRNPKMEEIYYRKVLEHAPEHLNALNNIGYCLFKQKRYNEAKQYLEKAISVDNMFTTAANNYVRVLLALKQYADAKQFVHNYKGQINKELKEKVKAEPNINQIIKKIQKDIEIEVEEENIEHESKVVNSPIFQIKGQQFTSEKLLEDELTARIENGIPVFGKKLKIYKRKGEYGRQYIIPVGRLDLLCEDNNGKLYIIELKKDSGYDDVYEQTARYLDWFACSEKFKNKSIVGIICLNSPTPSLIEKVRTDKRMELYEYQISYIQR